MEDGGGGPVRQNARARAHALAEEFLARSDGAEFFEELYKRASGDPSVIPWANLAPDPLLIDWLTTHLHPPVNARALVIGCGLGDDAEELADWGFKVTAFDLSRTAVDWCRDRFIGSAVTYKVADLMNPPEVFSGAFDFVFEDSTLQTMQGETLRRAILKLSRFLAPGGLLLIVCRGRDEADSLSSAPPWALTEATMRLLELEGGLHCIQFEDFYDHEDPPVRRFRATYQLTA